MTERKVINKYYPPDFDPSKIPRARKPKNNMVTVRMMLPMSVRCNVCGEYLYKGKKFNSKKETILGEEYLGIKIFRFYMKCTNCNSEFTIKTDPENSDYLAEMGCSRNFEPWRENEKLIEQLKKERQEEEEGDTMKQLENKTLDSKVEMDIIEALDEIRALNARNASITGEQLIEHHRKVYEEMQRRLDEDEEAALKGIVFKTSSNYVKRISDEDIAAEESAAKKLKAEQMELQSQPSPSPSPAPAPAPSPASFASSSASTSSNSAPASTGYISVLPIKKNNGGATAGESKLKPKPAAKITAIPKLIPVPKARVIKVEKQEPKDEDSTTLSLVNY